MQAIVESVGGRKQNLKLQVIERFAKMRVGYGEIRMTILGALGEIKLIGEMNEYELQKVLDAI